MNHDRCCNRAEDHTVHITDGVRERHMLMCDLAPCMDGETRESIHGDPEFCGSEQAFADEYFRRDPSLRETILSGGF